MSDQIWVAIWANGDYFLLEDGDLDQHMTELGLSDDFMLYDMSQTDFEDVDEFVSSIMKKLHNDLKIPCVTTI